MERSSRAPTQVVDEFCDLDIHDDLVEEYRLLPALERQQSTTLEVSFNRKWENRRRVVTFFECRNVDVALDADVLAHNAPINTAAAEATTDSTEIKALMERHRTEWHVEYEETIDPYPKKLSKLSKIVLFRIRLFGGTLHVVASDFSVKEFKDLSSETN